jgi:hypothetical protein
MLGFVAQDQTNISADSLGVSINKPFREVLGSAALYICFLDRLHFDLRGRRVFGKKRLQEARRRSPGRKARIKVPVPDHRSL